MRQVISCGVFCVRTEPERVFLLLKHPDRDDLPKGHQKAGESDLETALRELAEETGITADQIRLDPDFRYEVIYQVPYKRLNGELVEKKVVIFLGYLLTEVVITPHEHGAFEWVKWNPPHEFSNPTLTGLLAAVEKFWAGQKSLPQ